MPALRVQIPQVLLVLVGTVQLIACIFVVLWAYQLFRRRLKAIRDQCKVELDGDWRGMESIHSSAGPYVVGAIVVFSGITAWGRALRDPK